MADTTVGKLKRSALLHYLGITVNNKLTWYLIGKDVEDASVELNPDTETFKNILDETSVTDNGYEPSLDVETYYANPSDGLIYTFLKDIAMNRLTGDSCKAVILEVLIDKTEAPFDAWQEDVIVKPQSYGGAQGGVRIPYNIAFCGNRVPGKVSYTLANHSAESLHINELRPQTNEAKIKQPIFEEEV